MAPSRDGRIDRPVYHSNWSGELMSRVFKFRCWSHEQREMWLGKSSEMLKMIEDGYPFELMQYTGLKDKNGVEIFEGDIVEFEWRIQGGESKGIHRAEVKWVSGSFVFSWAFNHELSRVNHHGCSLLWKEEYSRCSEYYEMIGITVIGNIYENPDGSRQS